MECFRHNQNIIYAQADDHSAYRSDHFSSHEKRKGPLSIIVRRRQIYSLYSNCSNFIYTRDTLLIFVHPVHDFSCLLVLV
jgi:hypothetical protein